MVEQFVNGGPFMWPILITLLAGLAISAERMYSLLMSSIDVHKFFDEISEKIKGENKGRCFQSGKKTSHLFRGGDFLPFRSK